ncbi:MAG: ABC transporter permease [Oscillatoriaceae bacterium SKW80]|nr:ABC transporter permease [Oscillatoriaceae bacterium SKYG93]MCX8121693.1 ABC transporter permease [Oscillatoriaceae bacterium SKW80]MDW8454002.1 ABC transporter permease [Oscillatoriaceae cyanobacterium SKYGB_i_bin93]HIK28754.1 ABC transporter permease [Oscillatoriaceae cyanobacterium M7585_C2015_266]
MLEPLPTSKKRYLQPSVFWSIRQSIPKSLSIALVIASLLVPLLLWALLSYTGLISPIFLPTPTAVLQAGKNMFLEDNLLLDILVSCGRVLAGFLAAAAVGIPVGIAMGTFPSMESLFSPFVGPLRYMPVAAFIPLIILWVGLGEEAKILIIFLGIVFYNAIMIADAVKFIPSELLNVAYTLGANRRAVLFRVILPAVFPSILDALRVNVAGAWNFLVVSELIAAENGLGFKIVQAQRFLQTDKVLFSIAIIGLIGWATDWFFKVLAKMLTPWVEH